MVDAWRNANWQDRAGLPGARGFELRAVVSLARLLSASERLHEARDLFTPVYRWFTDGFGTPDLKEAKGLLDELT
jgi:hypothetical protein